MTKLLLGRRPLAIVLLSGCSSLPCTDTGDGWLELPQSRVAAVAEIRTSGVCEAVKPEGDCTAGTCIQREGGGEPSRLVKVHGRSPGSCTLTVVFADDCPPATVEYKFRGPINNCCANACIQGVMGASYAIEACKAK